VSLSYKTIAAGALTPALAQQWSALQASSPTWRSPYFSPGFTQAVAGVRSDVYIALIEEGGALVGVLPFQRGSLGRGVPVGGPLSDFHGVVTRPGLEWSLQALLRAAGLASWTVDHLIDGEGHFAPFMVASHASPRMDLDQGYEAYVKAKRAAGSETVPKLQTKGRKMARELGELSFTYHVVDDAGLDELLAWKSEQLRQRGERVPFDSDWTVDLLRRIARTETEGFAGVCSELRAGGRVVARHLGMRSADTLHYWFPCYDPAYARYSPGIIGLLRLAETASLRGLRTIDLGRGDEGFKQQLMSSHAVVGDGIVTRAETLAGGGMRVLQAARRWYRQQGPMAVALSAPVGVLQDLRRQWRFR
jgi:CelD/BcsL family acetyltransferase involved in cellulose biosynthesis